VGEYEAIDRIDGGGGQIEYRPARIQSTRTVTAAVVALGLDDVVILCDTSLNSITINLPAAATAVNKMYTIKKINVLNIVTIDASGAELIDDLLTLVFATMYESYTIICDGAKWWVI
jgi:hypothetical protein